MAEADNPTLRLVGQRADDDTSLKLYEHKNGEQDLVVEISDKMRAFLRQERSEAKFDYGPNQLLLARYNPEDGLLTTYPTRLVANRSDLGMPKYDVIRRISIENAGPLFDQADDNEGEYFQYRQFPPGFVDGRFDGFGLIYILRFIVEAIEQLPGVEEIRICGGNETAMEGPIFRLPVSIYEPIRKTLNRTHRAALSFANVEKRGFLQSDLINPHLPEADRVPVALRTRADLHTVLDDAINAPGRRSKARADNQSAAVRVVKSSAKALVANHHDELLELNREIELVTLEDLISKFQARLSNQTLKENSWQKFLSNNPFILRLAFGLPAIVFREQMPVGGVDFDNKGGKLADFVVKSGAVGNLSIVEIKTPNSKLLSKTEYRGGIHAPSSGLSGAVTQVMDQRYLLQENIAMFLRNSTREEVHTYAVGCIVVIGTTPTAEPARKSLELYRNNLRGVTVITFDELLDKLKALHTFLVEPPMEKESDHRSTDDDDLLGVDADGDLEEDEDGEE